jgi:NO-binding membrane sensor protein with MHYT domain
MHNIALLGFSIPGQTISYDVPMSLLSGLVAVAVVFAALMIAGSDGAGFPRLLLGGIVIGGGVLYSMDFVGMAAMRMPDTIQYNAWGVLLSVLVAVAAATLSLWAALRHRGIRSAVVASVAMGVAISGMHYIAMTAMRFIATPGAAGMLGGVTAAEFVLPLILVISILTFILIISVALGRTEEQIRAEAALNVVLARHRRDPARLLLREYPKSRDFPRAIPAAHPATKPPGTPTGPGSSRAARRTGPAAAGAAGPGGAAGGGGDGDHSDGQHRDGHGGKGAVSGSAGHREDLRVRVL